MVSLVLTLGHILGLRLSLSYMKPRAFNMCLQINIKHFSLLFIVACKRWNRVAQQPDKAHSSTQVTSVRDTLEDDH